MHRGDLVNGEVHGGDSGGKEFNAIEEEQDAEKCYYGKCYVYGIDG